MDKFQLELLAQLTEFSIDEIVDILVKHGQSDPQFHLGETIKYSPSEVKHILLEEIEKRGWR